MGASSERSLSEWGVGGASVRYQGSVSDLDESSVSVQAQGSMYGSGLEARLGPDSGLFDQGQAQSVTRIRTPCMDQSQSSVCDQNTCLICVQDKGSVCVQVSVQSWLKVRVQSMD